MLPLQVLRCSLSRRSTAKFAPTDILRKVLPPRGYCVREPLTTINLFATRMSVTSSREQAGPSCRELRVMRLAVRNAVRRSQLRGILSRNQAKARTGFFAHEISPRLGVSGLYKLAPSELLTLEMNRSAIARMVSSKVSISQLCC